MIATPLLPSEHVPSSHLRNLGWTVGTVAGGLALLAAHWDATQRPLTETSLLALPDALFSLLFVGVLLLLAWAIGVRLLRVLAVPWHSQVEAALFGAAVGLALLSYLVFTLACLGLLYGAIGAASLTILGLLVRSELVRCVCLLMHFFRSVHLAPLARRGAAVAITLAALALLVISLSVALLPPFSYDALSYHLAGPQAFLAQHRLVALPAMPTANMPLAVEMLYTICLMFGVQNGPALIHLACAVLLTLATWSYARRWLSPRAAWLAVAALLSASDLTHWAPLANIDVALALYVFLAFYALTAWLTERASGWLVLAGIATGMAMAAKYTAVTYLAIFVLVLLVALCRSRRELVAGGRAALLLSAIALAVASPWYVKNAIVLHDPLYPLLAPSYVNPLLVSASQAPSKTRPAVHTWQADLALPWRLLQSEDDMALAGRSWRDYLALPVHLYSRGDLETYGRPSLLFLLAPLAFFTRGRGRQIRLVGVVAALAFAAWAVGGQEMRYLLPVFPMVALLAGGALNAAAGKAAILTGRSVLVAIAVSAALVIALAESLIVTAVYNPLPVLIGQQSEDAFLRREVNVYGAYAYLRQMLLPGQRVLALGDSRGYYTHLPVVLDSTYDLERRVFIDPGSPAASAALLQRAGISFVLVDRLDLTWRQQFNPAEAARETAAFEQFRTANLVKTYDAMGVQVYRVVGGAPA